MGEAADRKVKEIQDARRQLEDDLRELEDRLPAPLRSVKSMVGVVVGSTVLTALVLRLLRSRRTSGTPSAEVVVRIVRDD
jgi:hypothetical protein